MSGAISQDVRDPLGRDVRTPELGYRVVPVAEKDVLVELAGALALLAVVGPGGAALEVTREFVEKKAAERARIARITGEQRPLDRLRQVHQAEDRLVEVREVRLQSRALFRGELFDGVL